MARNNARGCFRSACLVVSFFFLEALGAISASGLNDSSSSSSEGKSAFKNDAMCETECECACGGGNDWFADQIRLKQVYWLFSYCLR
jgi:hypothetical protein